MVPVRRFVFGILIASLLCVLPLLAQYGTRNGEWRIYGGDGSTRYSPLDQINRDNVKDLKVAWTWKSDNLGRPEIKSETTPIMINGVLYFTAGDRRNVVAIDAGTGETLWLWRIDEGKRYDQAPRKNSGRGVAYWTDGRDERILTITPGFELAALRSTMRRCVVRVRTPPARLAVTTTSTATIVKFRVIKKGDP